VLSELRRPLSSLEDRFFLSAALLSLLASAGSFFLQYHLAPQNERVRYALHHLPLALLGTALFVALVGRTGSWLRACTLGQWPTRYYLAGIAAFFAVCWMPCWIAGGFVADDWPLLAAASVRKIVYLHPAYSWYALDSVDGNFRPLSTVLYFGFMLKWFGTAARAFTFGSMSLTLLGGLCAFAIVREMQYSRAAAAAASLLFLSRGAIYTIVNWACALGDCIAILFCALTAWMLLKANKRRGRAAWLFHLLAWLSFCVAALGKQSSFVAPILVALLLFLRPGTGPAARSIDPGHRSRATPTLTRRAVEATVAFCVYTATAAGFFFHAKDLLRSPSPYPIRFSLGALFQTFSYATWYFVVAQFPDSLHAANLLPALFGFLLVAAAVLLAWKFPSVLGERPKDIVFCALAAIASISLFVLLGTRSAPYYGSMSAFWVSIALGIALTRYGIPGPGNPAARLSYFLFCLLLVTGFAEIRLEQTGLIPSGGYLWGTFGMDTERTVQADLKRAIDAGPAYKTLLLASCPPEIPYAAMALLDAPSMQRLLLYDPQTGAYTANDLQGLRPADDFAELRDPLAYRWNQPLNPAVARDLLSREPVLRLRCDGRRIEREMPGEEDRASARGF
jgi:hypothetical protein